MFKDAKHSVLFFGKDDCMDAGDGTMQEQLPKGSGRF
jgi:hypothetical protein